MLGSGDEICVRSDLVQRLAKKKLSVWKLAIPMVPEVCSLNFEAVGFLWYDQFAGGGRQGLSMQRLWLDGAIEEAVHRERKDWIGGNRVIAASRATGLQQNLELRRISGRGQSARFGQGDLQRLDRSTCRSPGNL